MKREDILAMPAGRELDNAVAHIVMGWTDLYGGTGEFLHETGLRLRGNLPHYSTSISAAFEVEAIFDQDSEIRAGYAIQLHNVLGLWLHEPTTLNNVYQIAHATPEQRCKAALLTVLEGQTHEA